MIGLTALRRCGKWWGIGWMLLLFGTSAPIAQAGEDVLTLGVYAYRTPAKLERQYQPFIDYLNHQVSGFKVKLAILDNGELRTALRKHQLDFVLVNPSLYEIIRNENSLTGAIATVQRERDGEFTTSLGGVVFTLASRSDIQTLHSLKGKWVAVPSQSNMGAYRIPLYEMAKDGVDKETVHFVTEGNNDSVVSAVLSGKADVGFVRTGILESWIDSGKLQANQIKVIHARQLKGYPYMLSTALYPEWPFVVLSHVDDFKTRQLVVALFNLKPSDPAAISTGIAGFVPPLDYLPVQNLLRDLRLSPYDHLPEFSWLLFWQAYRLQIILFTVLLAALVLALFFSTLLRGRLQEQTARLAGIITATRSGTWEWNVQTGEIKVNARWAELLGYDLSELTPVTLETWKRLIHPDDLIHSYHLFDRHFSGELDFYEAEVRMRHKDGHWVWVLDRGRVVKWSKDGQPVKVSGTHIDISKLKKHEALLRLKANRDEALLKLPLVIEELSEKSFLEYGLEFAESLTGSQIGFTHFIEENENNVALAAWSRRTHDSGCLVEHEKHYAVAQAGIWADAVREKQPVMVNDYASYSDKHGLPSGHTALTRFISVPVIENDKVVMVTGVGNKDSDYDALDVETLQLLSNEIWRLVQRKVIQSKMQKKQIQFERLVNEIGDNYVVFSYTSEKNILTYVSGSIYQVFGIKKEAVIGTSWENLVDWSSDELGLALTYKQRLEKGIDDANEFNMRFSMPDGEVRTIKIMQHAVRNAKNELISIDGLIENITEKIRAEKELKQAASVFEYAQEGIMITDSTAKILNVNAAFSKITGYPREDVIGKNPNILSSGRHNPEFYAALWKDLFLKGHWSGEIWNRRKNGTEYPEKVTISTIYDAQGNPQQFIALFSDISLQKQHQAQLEYIAHFDALTGLPNRTLLSDRLGQSISYSNRHKTHLAVIFIDLDGFKAVNDIYGHQSGDQVLITIAQRFQKTLRESDTIARLGGDEFVAVVSDLAEKSDVDPLLQRLLTDANQPIDFMGTALGVSASIGVTYYPQDTDIDADQLMRQADQAMYQAKLKGKNQIYIFDASSSQDIAQNSELLALKNGLNKNELCLYYQPKVNMKTGQVLAFEALIRWQHPHKGFLLPGAFLPLLQDQPLSLDVGYWVIETALKQISEWQEKGKQIAVSVNVEGELLQQADFIDRLKALLDKYSSVAPQSLTLEVLETSALEDLFSVSNVITESKKLGVGFSIDDFGTGYASLTYLKNLPVDELKVDQSFVQDLLSDPQSFAIMESLISMGTAFNLNVIAEGVETDDQARMLLRLGYELAQGYRIAKPMPVDRVLDWLENWQAHPAWQEIDKVNDDKALSLIALATEHRAWVVGIEKYVHSKVFEPPVLDEKACGFAKWLSTKGETIIPDQVKKRAIDDLHHQVHEMGRKIVLLKKQDHQAEAEKALEGLHQLKEKLLKEIESVASLYASQIAHEETES